MPTDQVSLFNMLVTNISGPVGASFFFSRQPCFSQNSTFITKLIHFYVYIYLFILTVKSRLMDQRPKDYVLTEYHSIDFHAPWGNMMRIKITLLIQKSSVVQKRNSKILTLKTLKGSLYIFLLPTLREGDKYFSPT